MKNAITVFFALVIFTAAGCASFGDRGISSTDQATVDRYIVDGRTTMADVRAVFGETSSKRINNAGEEFWYYGVVNQSLAGASVRTLTVTFDSHGMVTGHSYVDKSKSA